MLSCFLTLNICFFSLLVSGICHCSVFDTATGQLMKRELVREMLLQIKAFHALGLLEKQVLHFSRVQLPFLTEILECVTPHCSQTWRIHHHWCPPQQLCPPADQLYCFYCWVFFSFLFCLKGLLFEDTAFNLLPQPSSLLDYQVMVNQVTWASQFLFFFSLRGSLQRKEKEKKQLHHVGNRLGR